MYFPASSQLEGFLRKIGHVKRKSKSVEVRIFPLHLARMGEQDRYPEEAWTHFRGCMAAVYEQAAFYHYTISPGHGDRLPGQFYKGEP